MDGCMYTTLCTDMLLMSVHHSELLMSVHHFEKNKLFHACDVGKMAVSHNQVLWNSNWLPETQTDCLLS